MDPKHKLEKMIINEIKNLQYTIDQLVLLKNSKLIERSRVYSKIYDIAMNDDYRFNYFKNSLTQISLTAEINEIDNMIKSQENLINLQFEYLEDLNNDKNNKMDMVEGLSSDNIIV